MPRPGVNNNAAPEPRGEYDPDLPTDPVEQPGFEIRALNGDGVGNVRGPNIVENLEIPYFIPDYYPDRFRQTKDKSLERDGKQCQGEDVTIDKIKNREFHVNGIMLEYEVGSFNRIADFNGTVEVISPMVPRGAMRCFVKSTEVGENQGWDPHAGQWMFEYTIDLVSTGEDEYRLENGRNHIVTSVIND